MRKVTGIVQLEGDPPPVQAFDQMPAPPPRGVPPPARGAVEWWTCGTDGCRMQGYAATADRVFNLKKDTVENPPCAFCRAPLLHLQTGGYPSGYPRHEIADPGEGQMRGQAQMGRTRIVE